MKALGEKKQRHSCLKIVGRTLASKRGVSLIVVIMLMVIILAITGAGLLFSSMDLRISGNYRLGTQAFFAADTGASRAVAQLQADPLLSAAPILRTGLDNGFYCSGSIAYYIALNIAPCTPGQEPPLARTSVPPRGHQLPGGGGYNSASTGSAFVAYQYTINTTGIGPLGAQREVQALAEISPIPGAIK
ncbi:MAG: pilus assembly PilX family protein [Candidatus Binatia bacterium]